MSDLDYSKILSFVAFTLVILVSLTGESVFASPYALQNPAGTVNSTDATSGNANTSPNTYNPSSNGAITVTTGRASYNYGDTIIISGSVQSVVPENIVTIMIRDQNYHLVQATQIDVSQDGTYSDIVKSVGIWWKTSGIYTVRVQYGPPNVTAQTTFSFQITTTSSPINLVAKPVSSSEVDLSWEAPQNNGGIPITGYKIERNDGNGFNVIANSQTTTYQDKSLTPNPEHSYRVSAINLAGSSNPSNSSPVIMPSYTTTSVPNTNPFANQNSNQSLNDILKQRYDAAKKLQIMLNAQAANSSSNPQQSTPIHINPYIRCTNCTDAGNNQNLTQSAQDTSTPITIPAKIPNWVKGVFGYYAQGKLSDADIISALQFLIQQGIIKI